MKNDKSTSIIIVLLVIIVIILASLVILFMTDKITLNYSNNNKVNTEKNDENILEKDNTDTTNNDSININNDEIYSSIITEYRNAINDISLKDDFEIISSKYPNINERMLIFYHLYKSANSALFKYIYYDINKDGSDEIIIAEEISEALSIIDVFSYNGSVPIKLIDEYSLGDRSSLQIWNNGILELKGSTGASAGIITFSKIASDSYSNEIIQSYHYRFDEQNNISFYTKIDEYGTIVEESKCEYNSIPEVQSVYTNGASIVDINNLNWKNF